ncbi:hypothetical protein GCM10023319_45460 [Nocardia iowensis]|uniref:Uncharacterized protein n=2 Tax=Nocardia iowensis TaxID=204891 RepID=A0ABX8S3A4_NOCIO|nr:hypothetical protein KV110_17870 [Nocardia iowensis]
MSYFDIEGYQPQWLSGRRAITATHGRRLQALVGCHLNRAWLIWDRDADEWFADGPILLDFDGEQVELNHQKFADLSITWNTIDPVGQATWSNGDDNDPEIHTFHLSWRHDTRPELTALEGRQLQAVELIQWADGSIAEGMVAVSFVFPDDRVTISNGMDENLLEFGAPPPGYRSHKLDN